MKPSLILKFYAALLAIVGSLGYLQAGSVISMIAGVGSGIILLVIALFMSRGERWSVRVGAVVTLLLLGNFVQRYMMKTPHPFWPNLFMALVSIIFLAWLLTSAKSVGVK